MYAQKLVVLLGLAILSVHAQDSSDCLTTCIGQNLSSSSCSGITDVACICSDTNFQTAVGSCLQSTCPDQIEAAMQVQQQQCSAVTTASGSASETAGSSTVASDSTSSAPASSGSSSAPRSTNTTPSSSTRSVSGSGTMTSTGASTSSTSSGNAAAPAMLVSGHGAALAIVAGLVGIGAGGFIL